MLGLVRTFGSSNERSGAERERALGAGLMSEPRASPRALGKYDARFREAFRSVPEDEVLLKVYSCALLRDILLQGRLYISLNWLCFYANLFGKDIKVSVPVTSVQLVKKCRTARLLPNGLAVTTDTGQKYVFVSLLSRDSVYDVLRRICTHLQVNGKKSLSPKQHVEEPSSLSLVDFPAPDEFPVPALKWRSKSSSGSASSSPPDLPDNSASSLERSARADETPAGEPEAVLSRAERRLLELFIVLIVVLILSSCYLAFRVCTLEEQLSFLNTKLAQHVRER